MLSTAVILAAFSTPAAAEGVPPVSITHTAPSGVIPDRQVYLTAVLTNATAATVLWRNSTMTADEVVPMTNLSLTVSAGWEYAAYLPAQSSPTQITYLINATNAGGFHRESYFFSVDVPSASGLTAADQGAWILTMAASLTMTVCTLAVLYWYTGRRLRREGR